MMLGVGLAVDYTRVSNERSTMQNALDAAVLAALREPPTATQADRQKTLENVYAANDGIGIPAITSLVTDSEKLNITAKAASAFPVTFMALGGISNVDLAVEAASTEPLKLVQATFTFDDVWGSWSKDITLKGRPKGASLHVDLMRIEYRNNLITRNASMKRLDPNGTTYTETYSRVCAMSGDLCFAQTGDKSAVIDLTEIDDIYLQFKILGTPATPATRTTPAIPATPDRTYNSNDASQAKRFFIATYPVGTIPSLQPKQVQQTSAVEILNLIPCGQESHQSWEDGWSTNNLAEEADFHYYVIGKCKPTGNGHIRLTQ